jgi:hypothetical protein
MERDHFCTGRCEPKQQRKGDEMNGETEKSRQAIIKKARNIRKEIAQIFLDAEHWNNTHRNEEPINPDPDGRLKRMGQGLDAMLQGEQ